MFRQTKETIFFTILAIAMFLGMVYIGSAQQTQPVVAFGNLTKISEYEYVDLSKVAYIRLPHYTVAPRDCPDCETRWGAEIVVNSNSEPYSVEAEETLKRLLGVK